MGNLTWLIEVEVMPKTGVNDPQGDAVMSGLLALGFAETQKVRCGKLIRVEVVAESETIARNTGTEMCQQLLANPVIEEFEITVTAMDPPQ